MSNDEATRIPPVRRFARDRNRLRGRQREGLDTTGVDDDHNRDEQRRAGAWGSVGPHSEPPPVRLRALEQQDPSLGGALDPRTGSRRAAVCGRGSEKAGGPGAVAFGPLPSPLDPARPVLHASNSHRARTPTRPAALEREARWAVGRAQREGTDRTSPRRSHEPLRRLESPNPGLSRVALGAVLAAVVSLVFVTNASADKPKPPPPTIKLGYYSQQVDRGRARIGVSIDVKRSEPGRERETASRPTSRVVRLPVKGGAVDDLPDVNPYPPLPSDSALARNPQPFGPGSFWYPVGPGRVCMYAPGSVLPCFTLVGPGGNPGGPGLNPEAIAASVADRLTLATGRIETSPRLAGLTGAASWFWLDPGPRAEQLTASLVGETVTVRAEPSAVEWRFGDRAGLL